MRKRSRGFLFRSLSSAASTGRAIITLEPKTLTADGNDYRIAFIEAPDGYKIELVQRGMMKVGEMYQ